MLENLRYGVEIETVGVDRRALAEAIRGVVGGSVIADYRAWKVVDARSRTWMVVTDGSLSHGDASGEIVTPILGYADLEELQGVVRAVRGVHARVDETCSIHVHVGAEAFDPAAIARLAKSIHKQERLLEKALGISQGRLARYCRPMDEDFMRRLENQRPRTMQQISAAWYGRRNVVPQRYDSHRYHGLNLTSLLFRGTLEYRWFQGSLHAGEIKSYIQFCLALCARALKTKAASSRRREFNPASAKYDMRVWLLSLQMIGPEFKTARFHLLKRLSGSSAWKHGGRARRGDTVGSERREAA